MLHTRGFFVENLPNAVDMSDPEPVLEQLTATAPTADDLPQPSTSEEHTGSAEEGPDSEGGSGDPMWQKPTASGQTSVRQNMQKMGLYEKFPSESSLLAQFKEHLLESLNVPNCQQEVDNVSRMLRYMQPEGDEISLDFLTKFQETKDFIRTLKTFKMGPATILNYLKNMIRFVQFLKIYLNFVDGGDVRIPKCQPYIDLLNILRKPLAKENSRLGCKVRHDRLVDGQKSLKECQKVIEVAKKHMLFILSKLLSNDHVTNEEKTMYRYYCEAIVVLKHCQRPGVVEGFRVSEWLKKFNHDGRIIIGVSHHKTANLQIANFGLTMEQDALLDGYYRYIRPETVQDSGEENDRFFISSNGRPIWSATNDINRLHEHYKCPKVTSQEVRRALETKVDLECTEEQKKDIAHYLAHSTAVANAHYRMRDATAVTRTSVLMSAFDGSSEDSADDRVSKAQKKREAEDENKNDFSEFIKAFPATLDGQPPNKKQRAEAGLSEKRVFYDKWRAHQYLMREQHMLGKYTRRPPTAKQVSKNIKKEGWKANHPTPEEIVTKWKPPQKTDVEKDKRLMKLVRQQQWSGLTIKTFPGDIGNGVVTTKKFPRGSILCDYHGKVITAEEGERIHNDIQDEKYYMFFFTSGKQKLCIDAQNSPCECHPDKETLVRLINHSRKRANVVPVHCLMQFPEGEQHVILFKALKDISIDEELRFDYGINRKSFRGEGLDLEWLDE